MIECTGLLPSGVPAFQTARPRDDGLMALDRSRGERSRDQIIFCRSRTIWRCSGGRNGASVARVIW
jgi:hypothetical protein